MNVDRRAHWEAGADLVVIGSGVAGLTAALDAAAAGLRVVVVTKDAEDAGSTRWAQGGVAVVVGDVAGDSVDAHVADTLTAGAGLCDAAAVASILADGPAAVARLRARGAVFDTTRRRRARAHPRGRALGVPRGPRRRRRHGRRDRAGARRRRPRQPGCRCSPGTSPSTRCGPTGARSPASRVLDDDGRPGLLRAPAVLLATGGYGQLFASTTNPATSTGDGVALALRAGATAADLEFVQFHPTVLYLPGALGHRPLVTEAVRGEGGVLRRPHRGAVHARRAPAGRARAARRRRRGDHAAGWPRPGTDCVWLDATAVDGFARPLPDGDRLLPGRGDRPRPRADPGDAGRALRLRRRASPTSTDAPPSAASTPPGRWPARACTARTASRRTRCSRASSWAPGWPARWSRTSPCRARCRSPRRRPCPCSPWRTGASCSGR